MKIRFPYPGEAQINYYISQGYDSNPINPQTGQHFYAQHHGGWDIVPLTHAGGNFWPAPIYPVLDGTTLSASTTDIDRGLGIKVRTVIDQDLINYFKKLDLIPNDYSGEVWLDHLYWHMLKVTDLDNHVDENTQVGLTGNSGNVFAGGLPVPDNQKNVPPYPGAHLHLEFYLRSPNQVFNTDKDSMGRIDPQILFNYKGQNMQFKTQEYKGELRIVLQADSPETWKALCKVYGIDPVQDIDEVIN